MTTDWFSETWNSRWFIKLSLSLSLFLPFTYKETKNGNALEVPADTRYKQVFLNIAVTTISRRRLRFGDTWKRERKKEKDSKREKRILKIPTLYTMTPNFLVALSLSRKRDSSLQEASRLYRHTDSWLGSEMHWPMTSQQADRRIVVDRVQEDDARSPANSHVL